jgi:hypothetical protein
MATSGTDIFQSSFTQVAGFIKAGSGSIKFYRDTTDDGVYDTEYTLAVYNVEFNYQQPTQFQVMQDGNVLVVLQPSVGTLRIGGLVGENLESFVTYYSDPCNMNGNELQVKLEGDLECSTNLNDVLDSYATATLTLHGVLLTGISMSTQTEGVLVRSNAELKFTNVEWTIPTS